PCNERKGDRTPEEAGMPLWLPPAVPQRARPYAYQTAALLWSALAQSELHRVWSAPGDAAQMLSRELWAALMAFAAHPTTVTAVTIVKPVSRPRKQRFTARNYPLSTPLQSSMVRVGQTIKRRVRVNRGLLVEEKDGRRVVRVVGIDNEIPDTAAHIITIG